jgi:hypothetical protein
MNNSGTSTIGCLSYRNGIVTVQQSRIEGSGTDFSLQGAIPVKSEAPLSVSANGFPGETSVLRA